MAHTIERIGFAQLIDMDARRLDDLGLTILDVEEALQAASATPTTGAGRPSKISMTDGPFAETKEHVGASWFGDPPPLKP